MPWQLVVAGDGQARDAVMQAFTWALPDRVRFLGLVQPEVMPALYAACDLLVWPAVNEAFGMVLLEAQGAGLPVVAGPQPADALAPGFLVLVGLQQRQVEQSGFRTRLQGRQRSAEHTS